MSDPIRPVHVVIATPVYDDYVRASYHFAQWGMMGSPAASMIDPKILTSHDVCLGRSRAVRIFLEQTRGTHLLFWDADVCGDTGTALANMVGAGVACIGAAYPKKHLRDGRAQDLCLTTAGEEIQIVGQRAALPPTGGVGAGFLLLSRELLTRMCATFDDALYFYDDDEARTVDLFARMRATGRGGKMRALPEDFSFCRRVAMLGETVWLYTGPGSPLDHVGVHTFKAVR